MNRFGSVKRTLSPGSPGTAKYIKLFGRSLVAVRYRYDRKMNKRITTAEIIINQGFWDGAAAKLPKWSDLNGFV